MTWSRAALARAGSILAAISPLGRRGNMRGLGGKKAGELDQGPEEGRRVRRKAVTCNDSWDAKRYADLLPW